MNLVSPALPSVAWTSYAILCCAVGHWMPFPPPPAPDPISTVAIAFGVSAIMLMCIGRSSHHTTTSSDATTSDSAHNQVIKKDAPTIEKIYKNKNQELLSSSHSSLPAKILKRLLSVFRNNLRLFGMLFLLLPIVKGDDDLHPGLTFK